MLDGHYTRGQMRRCIVLAAPRPRLLSSVFISPPEALLRYTRGSRVQPAAETRLAVAMSESA